MNGFLNSTPWRWHVRLSGSSILDKETEIVCARQTVGQTQRCLFCVSRFLLPMMAPYGSVPLAVTLALINVSMGRVSSYPLWSDINTRTLCGVIFVE